MVHELRASFGSLTEFFTLVLYYVLWGKVQAGRALVHSGTRCSAGILVYEHTVHTIIFTESEESGDMFHDAAATDLSTSFEAARYANILSSKKGTRPARHFCNALHAVGMWPVYPRTPRPMRRGLYKASSARCLERRSTKLVVRDEVEPLVVWIVAVCFEFDPVRFLIHSLAFVVFSSVQGMILPAPTRTACPMEHQGPRHRSC